jgi:hypothetical protein
LTTQDGFFFRFIAAALDRGLVLPSQVAGLVIAYDEVRQDRSETQRSEAEFSFDCLAEAANLEVISDTEGGRLLGLMRELVAGAPDEADWSAATSRT